MTFGPQSEANIRSVLGACPSCGYAILNGSVAGVPRAPIPRPWHLYDRSAVLEYVVSLSEELCEWLLALFVDDRRQLLSVETIAFGDHHNVSCDLHSLFYRAIKVDASAFFLVHNHPSRISEPSMMDLMTTSRIRSVGHELRIPLLDHFLFANGNLTAVQ